MLRPMIPGMEEVAATITPVVGVGAVVVALEGAPVALILAAVAAPGAVLTLVVVEAAKRGLGFAQRGQMSIRELLLHDEIGDNQKPFI